MMMNGGGSSGNMGNMGMGGMRSMNNTNNMGINPTALMAVSLSHRAVCPSVCR